MLLLRQFICEVSRRQALKLQKSEAVKIINDQWRSVIIPRSHQSCVSYSRGTKWCIGSTHKKENSSVGNAEDFLSSYDQYADENHVIVIVVDKMRKASDPLSKIALTYTARAGDEVYQYDDALNRNMTTDEFIAQLTHLNIDFYEHIYPWIKHEMQRLSMLNASKKQKDHHENNDQ